MRKCYIALTDGKSWGIFVLRRVGEPMACLCVCDSKRTAKLAAKMLNDEYGC
jgi:hypothetical protein